MNIEKSLLPSTREAIEAARAALVADPTWNIVGHVSAAAGKPLQVELVVMLMPIDPAATTPSVVVKSPKTRKRAGLSADDLRERAKAVGIDTEGRPLRSMEQKQKLLEEIEQTVAFKVASLELPDLTDDAN